MILKVIRNNFIKINIGLKKRQELIFVTFRKLLYENKTERTWWMKREVIYDYIRVLSCVGIIGIHVSDMSFSSIGAGLYAKAIFQVLFRLALPIFFALSGALLLQKKEESLSIFYYKRIYSVYIPFLVYSLLYYIYLASPLPLREQLSVKYLPTAIMQIPSGIQSILDKPAYFHLWFVYSIMGIYLVTPFIRIMVNNMTEVQSKTLMMVILFVTLTQSTFQVLNVNIRIDEFIFFSWIKYYILGYFLTQVWMRKNLKKLVMVGIIGFFVAIIVSCWFSDSRENYFYDLGFLSCIETTGVFSLFILIKKYMKLSKVNSVVAYLSKYTFSIYLIHGYLLKFLNIYTPFCKTDVVVYQQIFNTIASILTVFISSFMVSFIIDNTIVKLVQFIFSTCCGLIKTVTLKISTKVN